MKKKTMLEKAKAYKKAAFVAGVLIPGTGVATILNNMSQIYMACDVYWHPARAEGLVTIFAPNGDDNLTMNKTSVTKNDTENNKKNDDGSSQEGES